MYTMNKSAHTKKKFGNIFNDPRSLKERKGNDLDIWIYWDGSIDWYIEMNRLR